MIKRAFKQLHNVRAFIAGAFGFILFMSVMSFSFANELSGSCGTFMEWSISGDVLTITGSGDMADYSDSKFAPWYPYAHEIREVELPPGILTVGDFAFYGCSNLTNIIIPEKVTEVGEYAFAQCTQLRQVHWSDGISKINEGVFQGCETLTTISFPETIKSIGDKSFYRCYNLQAVTIPSTVEYMGSSIFTYCTGLVRATVNAAIAELPGWTFYGCTSLTDVSLASNITSADDYAFVGCESLNGIYTQQGNEETAYKIEQSIEKSEGEAPETFVGTFDMPDSSIVTINEENRLTETHIIENGSTVINIKNITDYTENNDSKKIVISTTIKDVEDWQKIANETAKVLSQKKSDEVTVEINLQNSVVEGENLALFAGQNIILKLFMDNGAVWKIYMSEMTEKSFSKKYDLSVQISKKTQEEIEIVGEKIFHVVFADYVDFKASLGFQEGSTYDLASLYQKEEGTYQILNTVVVDQQGWAWFNIGKIDKKTEYCIGLNVEGVQRNDAVIPDTMLEYYDLEVQNEDSYLMDKDGVKYQITGRSSKWGISGKQFAIYVGVAILATVLVVGFIMTTLNIIKRSREKYEHMAEEEQNKINEEELRMEIMKEMLKK